MKRRRHGSARGRERATPLTPTRTPASSDSGGTALAVLISLVVVVLVFYTYLPRIGLWLMAIGFTLQIRGFRAYLPNARIEWAPTRSEIPDTLSVGRRSRFPGLPALEIPKNRVHHILLDDEGDDLHLRAAGRAHQRIDFVDPLDQPCPAPPRARRRRRPGSTPRPATSHRATPGRARAGASSRDQLRSGRRQPPQVASPHRRPPRTPARAPPPTPPGPIRRAAPGAGMAPAHQAFHQRDCSAQRDPS